MQVPIKLFEQSEIISISKALGDSSEGLTGSEIAHLLLQAKIPDVDPNATKWKRLHNAFCSKQNSVQNRTNILQFIREAMKPAKFIGDNNRYELLRSNLNIALSFSGLMVKETGELMSCGTVTTLTEAQAKANQLKFDLEKRDIHPDVIRFCRAELLHENYFHAVLEATKSVFDKLRTKANSIEDGENLINLCFSGDSPKFKINQFKTKSQRIEQTGFTSLLKGTYSMFRSPMAHEARINWIIDKKDAKDLLTLLSMIHRRIDNCQKC